MATYTFTLLIDSKVLAIPSPDNFCIAKKVDGKFTTVFQDASVQPSRDGQKTLITKNEFKWTDKYRIFATATYEHGLLVASATNNVVIAFGQKTIYDKNIFGDAATAALGEFSRASGPQSHEDSFLVNNIPSVLHAAVECEVGGAWAPIYVDPNAHLSTINKQLTPMNEYMLFWDSMVQTDSMIDQSRYAFPYTFSFPAGSTSKTIRFGYATPDKPTAGEPAKFYPM
ncbi:hypothetical protein C1H76_3682 [Elsinoe australis]|uniref:Uncharacterized protein n=1 Tax=Elsinoe australis TaxID=40998 RepID=A0A4U7B7M4_9PEZI|nr:hypothetical protein C1H76_3682 [Elsinoe australis]